MKLSNIAIVLLAFGGFAHAQSLPPTATSDGAVTVERSGTDTSAQAKGQAPIIVVSGSKKTTTSWVPPAAGTVTIKSPSGNTARTTVLNPSGSQVSVSGSAAAQPATIVRTGAVSRWVPKTQSCQAYYSGAISWEAEETQTVVSTWAETGTTRNYLNNCSPIVENRWVARSEACPAYYTGSKTWEAEETRSGGGAWSATGATRNLVNGCNAVTEIRWVAAAQACPANYSGSNTWEAEERRVGGGAWTATGAKRNVVNSCTAIVSYRWVPQSGACPVGYEGTSWWEAEQASSAGGPWSYTGQTRNQVNNCSLAVCTVKQMPFYNALNSNTNIIVPPEPCTAAREGRQALVYAEQANWNSSIGISYTTDSFHFVCQGGTWTFLWGWVRTPPKNEKSISGNMPLYDSMVAKNGQSPDHYFDLLMVAGIGYDQEVQARWAATPGANAIASYGCAKYW